MQAEIDYRFSNSNVTRGDIRAALRRENQVSDCAGVS